MSSNTKNVPQNILLELLNPYLKASDFPGSPVVKTPRFQCRGQVFDPWSGNYDPIWQATEEKKKEKKASIGNGM